MLVIAASRNPVKIQAVQEAFMQAFPRSTVRVEGIAAPSGVRDQPMSDAETLRGARNRVAYAKTQHPGADFWVGVEGGVQPMEGRLDAFGWIVVQDTKQEGDARSASFFLPPAATQAIREGGELGPVMDELFDETDVKHKGGAVGLLTNGLVSRQALYVQPLLLALIPFLQAPLFVPKT
jgi:inosine/xanthosine triphosphatase